MTTALTACADHTESLVDGLIAHLLKYALGGFVVAQSAVSTGCYNQNVRDTCVCGQSWVADEELCTVSGMKRLPAV